MKNRVLNALMLFAICLSSQACGAQKISSQDGQLLSKWYLFSNDGELSSYNEYENMILVRQEREIQDEQYQLRVDTIIVNKRLDADHMIVSNPGREGFGIMKRNDVKKDSIMKMWPLVEGKTIAEVETKFNEKEVHSWMVLNARFFYSEAMIQAMKQAPGLDQVRREDLMTSLNFRKELSPLLEAYLKDQQELPFYRLRRFVDAFRNQKLVLLGYNPYKRVRYNWHEQFKDDAEVMELLEKPISYNTQH